MALRVLVASGRNTLMLLAAILVAVVGFILKLIAVQTAGWFLVPLAAVACIYHIRTHALAARNPKRSTGLAAVSDIFLLGALLFQIDFTPGLVCGESTLDGLIWRMDWARRGCFELVGLPAILLDVALYLPVAVTWRRLHAI
jgi:hypothetical protein